MENQASHCGFFSPPFSYYLLHVIFIYTVLQDSRVGWRLILLFNRCSLSDTGLFSTKMSLLFMLVLALYAAELFTHYFHFSRDYPCIYLICMHQYRVQSVQYANSFIVLSMLFFVSAKKCVNLKLAFLLVDMIYFINNRDD